jgi:hypothetical protein
MGEERKIVHRDLDTDRGEPALQIVEIVAELEEKEERTLQSVWGCIDHVIDHLFSDPPSPDAQAQITFSYEGYRITVEQNGQAKFVKTA